MHNANALELLVAQVENLPGLAEVALRVIRTVDNPRSSAAQVAHELSTDQALTARVLKLANSVAFTGSRPISTVSEAVVRVGMRSIRNLAYAASCEQMMTDPLDGYALKHGELWRHSYACGMAAQIIAKTVGYKPSEEAFVAGLLHDIGKVMLNTYLRDNYARVRARVESDAIPFMEAEVAELGFDHAMAGGMMLKHWRLPENLVDAITDHYDPMASEKPSQLSQIVHVADIVTTMLGIGIGVDGLAYRLDQNVLDSLKITDESFEIIVNQVYEAALNEGLESQKI